MRGACAPDGRNRTHMRKKSWITLAVVTALIVFFSVVAFTGLTINHTQMPAPIGDLLSLGLDLRGGIYTVFYADDAGYSSDEFHSLLEGTASVLRSRLTDQGFTEANVSLQGSNYIRVEIPDVSDPKQVLDIIGTPAHLTFIDPAGNVVVEGKDVSDVEVWYNDGTTDGGSYMVTFVLNGDAAAAFEDATEKYVGQSIYIYLDDEMVSAPTIKERISGGNVSITMNNSSSATESYQDAYRLKTLIMSGALPLDIEESETRAISATLGEDAIDRALLAGIVGIGILFVFMIVMYRLPGLMADLALVVYILIVFYVLAEFQIQLTLPGIAGILLGIGMAVDANVVIFERFREELAQGRTPVNAVKFGFKNAGRAVADSNITTLIAAVCLLLFGTGTIKGFALTLLISVIASLFTAVVITRSLLLAICNLGVKSKAAYTR